MIAEHHKAKSKADLAYLLADHRTITMIFVQLTLVGPRLVHSRISGIEAFVFVPFDSFL